MRALRDKGGQIEAGILARGPGHCGEWAVRTKRKAVAVASRPAGRAGLSRPAGLSRLSQFPASRELSFS